MIRTLAALTVLAAGFCLGACRSDDNAADNRERAARHDSDKSTHTYYEHREERRE